MGFFGKVTDAGHRFGKFVGSGLEKLGKFTEKAKDISNQIYDVGGRVINELESTPLIGGLVTTFKTSAPGRFAGAAARFAKDSVNTSDRLVKNASDVLQRGLQRDYTDLNTLKEVYRDVRSLR